ncbi:MAG TPA: hypothetical protein VGV15_12360 [Terriglobales bacterium]|nr:hypothetical protein [Terriglobales bacterium]
MISKEFIKLYLWVAPHALLAVVAALMLRSKRHKDFPVFFSYLLFEILQFCVLFTMSRVFAVSHLQWQLSLYLKVDLLGRAGSIAFRFGMIQEMLDASVARCAPLRRAVTWMLRCAAAVLAVLALVFVGSVYSWSISAMIVPPYAMDQALNILQCGLLVFVFMWYRYLGLKMQGLIVGIALGMGLVAGLAPLVHALKDSRAVDSQMADFLGMGAYHVSVLIWLYYASVREAVTADSPVASFSDARNWASEVGRSLWS